MTPARRPGVTAALDRAGRFAVLALPIFLLHGRGIADALIAVVAALFLARSAAVRDWTWLLRGWVVTAAAWWGWLLLCSALAGAGSLLQALGVDASVFDATAVLIAMVLLAQLPIGPSVGAAAVVVILGADGVALTAAAGVLLTVTGTVGALCFAAWAGLDLIGRFPGAAAVAVYGVPDERTADDQVMASIEVADDGTFDPDAFARFLQDQEDLAAKWSPRYVRITTLPKSR